MKYLIIPMMLFVTFMTKAQEPYQKQVNYNIAVFLIDYTDIPSDIRPMWPTKEEWERTLFHGKIQNYYKTISRDEFIITGDIFDYTTSSLEYWDSVTGNLKTNQEVLNSLDFTVPDFDIEEYDKVVFVNCHDARLGGSNLGGYDFTINGTSYNRSAVFQHYKYGRDNRDSAYPLNNTLVGKKNYLLPLTSGGSEENPVWYDLSQTEATICHEFGHALGIQAHANSRTNGESYDYDPEISNNGSYNNREYGDQFDLMGTHLYGISLHGGFRDVLGMLPQENIETVDTQSTQTITIHPINSTASKRYIEVLLPFQNSNIGYKNKGYGLEVKTADALEPMLNHNELKENLEGLFVHKMDGLSSLLLDMSPSANINYSWGISYDIRDVVLKPGMTYENDEVKFSNVVKNSDGSFTVTIQIKHNKDLTPAPIATSAVRQPSSQVLVEWQNNHLSSGNTANITVQYKLANSNSSWSTASTSVSNNATSFLTGFGTNVDDVYAFRVFVQETGTNFNSLLSNVVATGAYCDMSIDNLIEYPISCNGAEDGRIEVMVSNGTEPYEYKINGGTYQSSNVIDNLELGTHDVWVRDANGCEVNLTSTHISEPENLILNVDLMGTDLTVMANYGSGNYQYKLDDGSWQDSNVFTGVTGDYTVTVRDRNGCEETFSTIPLGIDNFVINGFRIYPNPVEAGESLIFDYDKQDQLEVSIYSLLGEKIMDYKVSSNDNSIQIPQETSIGIYFCKVKGHLGTKTYKIIVE